MAEYTVTEKDVEFIPNWDGNKDRPEAEQIKFTLKYLSTSQRAKCWKFTADGVIDPDYDKLMINGVSNIQNLIVTKKGGSPEEITTSRQLGNIPGFSELYMEVGTEILILNARDDLKN